MDEDMEVDGATAELTEQCLIGNHVLQLPWSLTEDVEMFMSVMSLETWSNILSESQRRHLLKFLPAFNLSEKVDKLETIRMLFGGDNFLFGNPLKKFHKKLKKGHFSPNIAKYMQLLQKVRKQEYHHQQRVYYTNVLKEVLINRQRLLEAAIHVAPDQPIIFQHFQIKSTSPIRTSVESSAQKKFLRLMDDVNRECGVDDSSSEDEETSATVIRSRRHLLSVLRPGSPDTTSGTLSTLEPPPTMPINNSVAGGVIGKRPLSPVEMTEDDLCRMLHSYKRRRALEPTHPELCISGLTVDDVITRVQAAKKVHKVVGRRRVKMRKANEVQAQTEVHNSPDALDVDVGHEAEDTKVLDAVVKDGYDSDSWMQSNAPQQVELSPDKAHFFALLRDIIKEDPEERVTTTRVEERVREWQETMAAAENTWFSEQPNWVDQVAIALKFLSGDVLGLTLDNFVPFLDYKERSQHWKWIGPGRDSDEALESVFKHWLLHKDDLSIDTQLDPASSPPPPRCRTEYTVHPTSQEEKAIFRKQERERFQNPHRAFTYMLHGYEAVVGPVKGVYHKESAVNKAREHTILVSERPAYVTILTLVRDAAARLPNGEGTRSDICELLKDSQFLSPGIPDAQINTVVSGALDRLHYEKDPCVKYDVNRKLWIYLHRNRTQQEFEKIHLAQGAAVKAKKSLLKPKLVKKNKEGVVVPLSTTATTPLVITTGISRQSTGISTAASDVNIESVSPIHGASFPVTKSVISTVPKLMMTSSSPKASTPRVTPQHSPQVTSMVRAPSTTLVTSVVRAPSTTPVTSVVRSPSTTQMPTVSKLIANTLKQSTLKVSSVSQMTGTTTAGSAECKVSPETPQFTPDMSPNEVKQAESSSEVSISNASSMPRPVTLSLLHGSPKLETISLTGPSSGKPRTLLVQTQSGRVPRILTQHSLRGAMTQAVQITGSPMRVSTLASTATSVPATRTTTVTFPTTQTDALARAGVVQQQILVTTSKAAPAVALSKPMLARMVTGQPQVVSLSSLWATQSTSVPKKTPEPKTTVKIQAGGLVQTLASSPTVLTTAGVVSLINQSAGTPTISTSPRLQQVTVGRSGKPTTMVMTKQSNASTGRVQGATTQTVAQIIQSGALSGKSTMLGGKPIIIGGKSTMIGGKPLQLGGKPIQLIGKTGPLTAQQLSLLQSQGIVSAVNIVTQPGTLISKSGSLMTAANTILTQAISCSTVVPQTQTNIINVVSKASSTPTMVSQLLQNAQAQGRAAQILTLPQGVEGQLKVAGQIQAQTVRTGSPQQVVTVSGTSQHKVVTLAPNSLAQVQQIAASKTVLGSSGTKNFVIPAGGMVQGGQLVLQQQQSGLASGTRVLTQHQLIQAGGLRPTLFSTGGKGLQNLQFVKTIISQPGGKPGQTTILLAQPTTHTASTDSKSLGNQANQKGKAPPIYARIITPPPGVRLAAVRPGQVLTSSHVGSMQGINLLQSVNAAHIGQQNIGQVHQMVGQHIVQQNVLGSQSLPTSRNTLENTDDISSHEASS